MTPKKKLGTSALVAAATLMCALPSASQGGKVDLSKLDDALRQTTQQLGNTVQQSLDQTEEALRKAELALRKKAALAAAAERARRNAKTRATATDPAKQPPLHGANPHGQGGVAVVDLDPSNDRPLGAKPDGSDSGPEEAVVGRARGEKNAAGDFHGHITILALFGHEIAGVDSVEGETKHGPLQPIQEGILDPLCKSTSQEVCLSVLTANSTSAEHGSANDFAVARAKVLGLGVGAAESGGAIGDEPTCQTSKGSAKTANVVTKGGPVAQVANSTSSSKSCAKQAPQTLNTSTVIALGNNGLPLPAAGCADGTPDTVAGLPPLLPIVCNADEVAGSAAVREALDVFVLTAGNNSLAKETTAASESLSVAPAGPETTPAQCSDGADNDGDGKIDAKDPGCHNDGKVDNPASYNPNDNDETDAPKTGPSGKPNDGGKPEDGNKGEGPECSDQVDNDGDGVIDAADPGCHSDGDANNPDSYDANDDSEAGGARTVNAGTLPFTGSDVIGLGLAGMLLLAGGLLMRRREGARL